MQNCYATGKVSHTTPDSAQAHLRQLRLAVARYVGQVYRCPHCQWWHVGRPNGEASKGSDGAKRDRQSIAKARSGRKRKLKWQSKGGRRPRS